MSEPPARPLIYHITHIDNLASIMVDDALLSDAALLERGGPSVSIGMSRIKERRLALPIGCYPGDTVGAYVPFYFCPRSVMLFLDYRGNHPDLLYRGGQDPIVHLVADLRDAVAWADAEGRRWAFSLSNAGAYYTQFRNRLDDLDQIDWAAVRATDFRDADVREGKQAEFLMEGSFPFHLVSRIGVRTRLMKETVEAMFGASVAMPQTLIRPDWYY